MVEARLVPLLVGSLLAGGPNLEPLLLAASLQLLLALLAGDASRRAMLAEAGPVARVALSAMGSQQQQVRPLGLKLLQEVMLSGKVSFWGQGVLACGPLPAQVVHAEWVLPTCMQGVRAGSEQPVPHALGHPEPMQHGLAESKLACVYRP